MMMDSVNSFYMPAVSKTEYNNLVSFIIMYIVETTICFCFEFRFIMFVCQFFHYNKMNFNFFNEKKAKTAQFVAVFLLVDDMDHRYSLNVYFICYNLNNRMCISIMASWGNVSNAPATQVPRTIQNLSLFTS